LTIAQQLIALDDNMCVFHLENQFFQVRLSPDTKKYFGFAFPYPDEFNIFSSLSWRTAANQLSLAS
jgi:hypothetical protein